MAFPLGTYPPVARRSFGFERLRPGQEEAIAAVLKGRDVV